MNGKAIGILTMFILGSIFVLSAADIGARADDTPQTGTEVFFGDVKIDSLNNVTDESDWYKIDVRAGFVMTLNLTVPATGDFDLYLYDHDEWMVDWSEETAMGGFEEIVYVVDEPGIYLINCTAFEGNGDYTLKIDGVGPLDNDNDRGNATLIELGETKTSTMSVGSVDLQDWYTVNITEGDYITVNMTVPISGDYDLDVYDPNGLFIDDSYAWGYGGFEEVGFLANMSGFHYIFCTAFEGSGSYSLLVTKDMAPVIGDPIPNSENVSVNEGDTVEFNITVTDEMSDLLVYEWSVDGTVQADINGSVFEIETSYTDAYSAGSYIVEVTVTDFLLESDSLEWNLTVLDVNLEPEVTGAVPNVTNVTLNEGESATFGINVSDGDGTTPVIQWLLDGSPVVNETNTTYLFETDFSSAGKYTVRVNVTDETDDSIVLFEEWNVEVLNVDRLPEIIDAGKKTVEITEGDSAIFTITAADPDGDIIAYSWFFDGVEATGVTGNNYTFVSDYDSADGLTHTVMVVLAAGGQEVNTTWTLTIKNVNRAPVLNDSSVLPNADTVIEGGMEIKFFAEAADPDNEELTYTWKINETGDTFQNQTFNHTLAAGTYTVLLTVTDAEGDSDTFTITLTVPKAPKEDKEGKLPILWIIIAIIVVIVVIVIIILWRKKYN